MHSLYKEYALYTLTCIQGVCSIYPVQGVCSIYPVQGVCSIYPVYKECAVYALYKECAVYTLYTRSVQYMPDCLAGDDAGIAPSAVMTSVLHPQQ
jgi:hypothetical protein